MKDLKIPPVSRLSDLAGISVSGLCVVHCILTPVIFSLAPAFSHFVPASELTHRVLALSVTGIGALAFRSGYKKHRQRIVLWMMGLGLFTIGFSAFAGDRLPSHGYEIAMTVTGGAFLITAHLLNRTFCQKCDRCAPAHEAICESSEKAMSEASVKNNVNEINGTS